LESVALEKRHAALAADLDALWQGRRFRFGGPAVERGLSRISSRALTLQLDGARSSLGDSGSAGSLIFLKVTTAPVQVRTQARRPLKRNCGTTPCRPRRAHLPTSSP